MTQIKICGLSTPETITTAIEEGADFIGFVFYEPSPRHVDIETAKYLASFIPDTVQKVGLFVNPDERKIAEVVTNVPLDVVQLHGEESPARCQEIKTQTGLKIMKFLAIETKDDLQQMDSYTDIVDWFLLDAKGEELPGGNGDPFDWSILRNVEFSKPWMLAGGLTPENVAEAITIAHLTAVDVSSGVESQRGIKDADKIRAFIQAVKRA